MTAGKLLHPRTYPRPVSALHKAMGQRITHTSRPSELVWAVTLTGRRDDVFCRALATVGFSWVRKGIQDKVYDGAYELI